MHKIGTKILTIGALQLAAEVILIWLGTADGNQEGNLIARAAGAVGGLVPKALWYSSYFEGQRQFDLAAQLVRVNGICVVVFLVALSGCLIPLFVRMSGSSVDVQSPRDKPAPERKQRLESIGRMVLAVAILTAYYNLIGFGLQTGGTFPMETTAGNNVIVTPIVGFPFLLGMVLYVIASRRYLRLRPN